MVHDFVGARYNRVVLPGTAADGKMTSFAPHRDEFLTRARFATFPQVCSYSYIMSMSIFECLRVLMTCIFALEQMLRMKRELQTKFQEQRQLQAGLSKGSLEDIKVLLQSSLHSTCHVS